MIWYFVRHGETLWNKEHLFQGATDIELNDTGRQQAKEAFDRLNALGISFDKVISSPLCRAVETAHIISGFPKEKIILDDRIKEMSFGKLEGMKFEHIKEEYGGLFENPAIYIPKMEEEPYGDLMERTALFIEDLKKAKSDCGNILIQTHGACMRALLTNLRKSRLEDFWKISVGNCEFFRFEYRDGTLREIKTPTIDEY